MTRGKVTKTQVLTRAKAREEMHLQTNQEYLEVKKRIPLHTKIEQYDEVKKLTALEERKQ